MDLQFSLVRLFAFSLFFLGLIPCVYAQPGSVLEYDSDEVYNIYEYKEHIGKDYLQVVYEYKLKHKSGGVSACIDCLLSIGQEYTVWQSYNKYKVDSVLFQMSDATYSQYDSLDCTLGLPEGTNPNLWVDLCRRELTETNLRAKNYYTEKLPEISWILAADTATICEYPCKRALSAFRGRLWEVWYTESIPVGVGPWKLYGLRGLVLKARSLDGEIQFLARSVRDTQANMFIPLRLRYEDVKNRESFIRKYIKTGLFLVSDPSDLTESEYRNLLGLSLLTKAFSSCNHEEADLFVSILEDELEKIVSSSKIKCPSFSF